MIPPLEYLELFDEEDRPLGRIALRSECHGNPRLIHRTAHVVVFNRQGQLLLQKRTHDRDVQPGKWDTAVGGHLGPGETYEQAARREMNEELGIPGQHSLKYLFNIKFRNEIESENVGVFTTIYEGPFQVDSLEVDEIRFWNRADFTALAGTGIFTPNLEWELQRLEELGFL